MSLRKVRDNWNFKEKIEFWGSEREMLKERKERDDFVWEKRKNRWKEEGIEKRKRNNEKLSSIP